MKSMPLQGTRIHNFIRHIALSRRSLSRRRNIMRGYRHLKASGQIGRLNAIRDAITTEELDKIFGSASSLIFGVGIDKAEVIVRQYLLKRLIDCKLNSELLLTLGSRNDAFLAPLPLEWRNIVEQHDFKIARYRCTILWWFWIFLFLFSGIYQIFKCFLSSTRDWKNRNYSEIDNYVFLCGLNSKNINSSPSNHQGFNILSWYVQSPLRLKNLSSICHDVRNVMNFSLDSLYVKYLGSPIPPLINVRAVLHFLTWSVAAVSLSFFDVFRGRWWHALLLKEAALSANVRANFGENLASAYLFHNSYWLYRPLWTYEAEKYGSQIVLYFYSANCEGFKPPSGKRHILSGYQIMKWPEYWVWDEYQRDFIHQFPGSTSKVRVTKPIWFVDTLAEMPSLPSKSIAVFDVQPMRDSLYQEYGIEFDYYTCETAVYFLRDTYDALAQLGWTFVLKRKRDISRRSHPTYRSFLKHLERQPNFIEIDADMSAVRVIESCSAVISMPFTSTALIGRHLSKPSVYYDSRSFLHKDDHAAHGIEVLSGKCELIAWLRKSLGYETSGF